MKTPKIPHNFKATMTDADVIQAINFLIIQQKPTPMCCAGAVCVLRGLSPLFGVTNVDVHYTKAHVSIKPERMATKYWKKDAIAQEIDQAYDAAFRQALIKFGDPTGWFSVRRKLEKFILRRMQPFIGASLTFTEKGARHKRSGGPRIRTDNERSHEKIQCHHSRAEMIAKSLTDYREAAILV